MNTKNVIINIPSNYTTKDKRSQKNIGTIVPSVLEYFTQSFTKEEEKDISSKSSHQLRKYLQTILSHFGRPGPEENQLVKDKYLN